MKVVVSVVMLFVFVTVGSAQQPQRQRNLVPPGVTPLRDLTYARRGEDELKLDLYVPESSAGKRFPAIVWIHGGAWRAGSKRHCPALPYTQRGYVVASLAYRLSPVAKFPAQIEDCKEALRWLRANAAKYHIDPQRIGVWGSSAGGHLVALLGTSGDVQALEQEGKLHEHSSRVQAVVDFFGPTNFLRMDADSRPDSRIVHDAADSPESQLVGGPIQEHREKVAAADPITYVSKDDPPFFIVHGKRDRLVPWQQSQYLYEALRQANVAHVQWKLVEDAGHSMRGQVEVQKLVREFFDRHLRPDLADAAPDR